MTPCPNDFFNDQGVCNRKYSILKIIFNFSQLVLALVPVLLNVVLVQAQNVLFVILVSSFIKVLVLRTVHVASSKIMVSVQV